MVFGSRDQICPLYALLSLSSPRVLFILFPIPNPCISHYGEATSHLVVIISSLTILAFTILHSLKVSSCLNHKETAFHYHGTICCYHFYYQTIFGLFSDFYLCKCCLPSFLISFPMTEIVCHTLECYTNLTPHPAHSRDIIYVE